mgnify:CR=1 FL=1
MGFDALAPAASKENSYFSRGRILRGRMAVAKSGSGPIWGGGSPTGGVNKGSKQVLSTKYYYKQKGEVKYSTWLLWLGANNPTPGLRKTLTAPASRRGPWNLGACALGAPTFGGEQSASSAKDI